MPNVQKSKLTFVRITKAGHHAKAIYRCECGNEKELYMTNVNSGSTKSCGCSTNKTHGLSKTPLYGIWGGMIMRCENPNNEDYHNYGGRGVTVCDEWRNNPESFIEWALENGWKKGMEVDKDKSGSMIYSPKTCEIITKKENSNYRRASHYIEYNGKRQTLQQWSEETGIHFSLILARINRLKWSIEQALTIKPKYGRKIKK